jgi:hypothetical protein
MNLSPRGRKMDRKSRCQWNRGQRRDHPGDQAAGAIRTVETAPAGAHLNSPSWSPDGRKLTDTQFHANKSRLMVSGMQATSEDDVFPFPASRLPGNRILYSANGKIHVTGGDGGETRDIPFEAQFTLNRPPYQHKKFDLDSTASRQVLGSCGSLTWAASRTN